MCNQRHDCLVRTALEGWLQGKKGRARPRKMLLSWLAIEDRRRKRGLRWTERTGIRQITKMEICPYKGRVHTKKLTVRLAYFRACETTETKHHHHHHHQCISSSSSCSINLQISDVYTVSHMSLPCQSTDSLDSRQTAYINYYQDTLNVKHTPSHSPRYRTCRLVLAGHSVIW